MQYLHNLRVSCNMTFPWKYIYISRWLHCSMTCICRHNIFHVTLTGRYNIWLCYIALPCYWPVVFFPYFTFKLIAVKNGVVLVKICLTERPQVFYSNEAIKDLYFVNCDNNHNFLGIGRVSSFSKVFDYFVLL